MNGIGQYRSRGKNDESHTAFVNDRSISFDIQERLYRWRGYAPDFDQLPWVEMGEARPPRQSMGKKPSNVANSTLAPRMDTGSPEYGDVALDRNRNHDRPDARIDGS